MRKSVISAGIGGPFDESFSLPSRRAVGPSAMAQPRRPRQWRALWQTPPAISPPAGSADTSLPTGASGSNILEREADQAGVALCVGKVEGIATLERDIRRLAGGLF
jgi:hypothetical protein